MQISKPVFSICLEALYEEVSKFPHDPDKAKGGSNAIFSENGHHVMGDVNQKFEVCR